MNIVFKKQGISGELEQQNAKMVCIAKKKYESVELCVQDVSVGSMFVPFAEIKLHEGNTFSAAEGCFENASEFGDMIAKAWNEKYLKPKSS
ncbi:MAG TPA: hypothetical protein ENH94_11435 [Phycisphaerales bacterium]|nr:hypothetical protein [Phycisphaerales bacterium]